LGSFAIHADMNGMRTIRMMTEKDILVLLGLHAEELLHMRMTIDGLRHETLKLLEAFESMGEWKE
jgi:hypothetical protein